MFLLITVIISTVIIIISWLLSFVDMNSTSLHRMTAIAIGYLTLSWVYSCQLALRWCLKVLNKPQWDSGPIPCSNYLVWQLTVTSISYELIRSFSTCEEKVNRELIRSFSTCEEKVSRKLIRSFSTCEEKVNCKLIRSFSTCEKKKG